VKSLRKGIRSTFYYVRSRTFEILAFVQLERVERPNVEARRAPGESTVDGLFFVPAAAPAATAAALFVPILLATTGPLTFTTATGATASPLIERPTFRRRAATWKAATA
jgi:hypothetical protein